MASSLFLALALAPQTVEPNPTPAPSGPMPRPDGESLAGRKPILPDAAMCRVGDCQQRLNCSKSKSVCLVLFDAQGYIRWTRDSLFAAAAVWTDLLAQAAALVESAR